jgi:flagellar biosynthesis component FlhA
MRKTLSIWTRSFLSTLLAFTVISVLVLRRLNIQLPYLRLIIGAVMISFFVALGILIFKSKKGNPLINTILGYLTMVPSVLIMRSVFGILIFRYSFVIYLFIVLVGVIYAIAVMVVSKRYKNEAQELNKLLDKPETTVSDKTE